LCTFEIKQIFMYAIIFPILFFVTFFGLIFLIRNENHKGVKKTIDKILHSQLKLNKIVNSVKCRVFTSGARNPNYRFRLADLYFFENSFLIVGFIKLGNFKFYKSAILLSNNIELKQNNPDIKITTLRNINLHSFNKDVFIEFGYSKFNATNVEIRLKNLTEEYKSLIKFN